MIVISWFSFILFIVLNVYLIFLGILIWFHNKIKWKFEFDFNCHFNSFSFNFLNDSFWNNLDFHDFCDVFDFSIIFIIHLIPSPFNFIHHQSSIDHIIIQPYGDFSWSWWLNDRLKWYLLNSKKYSFSLSLEWFSKISKWLSRDNILNRPWLLDYILISIQITWLFFILISFLHSFSFFCCFLKFFFVFLFFSWWRGL